MSTISIGTFMKVALLLPATTSIMLRGDHGIGKSQIVRQVAAKVAEKRGILPQDFEFIDRRLSQMSEGDMIGLPSTDGNVTRFNPPDWFMRACLKPCCLFLDELNRATGEVMQAAFQIVLDRELNGHKLHPDTLVFTAINTAATYNVNEVDPALLDRFWVADLKPTVQDWIDWARDNSMGKPHGNNCLEIITDFIESAKTFLDTPKDSDPTRVTESRRSWERTGDSLYEAGMHESPDNPLFFAMVNGYVGSEAAIKFTDFARSVDNRFSGEDILNNYKNIKKKLQRIKRTETWNSGIAKLAEVVHSMPELTAPDGSKYVLTDAQGKNIRAFMDDVPGELKISLWTKLMSKGLDNMPLLKNVHKHLSPAVCETFGVPAGQQGVGVVPNIPGLFKPVNKSADASVPEAKTEKAAIASTTK